MSLYQKNQELEETSEKF
jgi:hypothetical protein